MFKMVVYFFILKRFSLLYFKPLPHICLDAKFNLSHDNIATKTSRTARRNLERRKHPVLDPT